MENVEVKQLILPNDVLVLSQSVSVEKRNEVQSVLNKVFDGVGKMRESLDAINVADENDKTSMRQANVIRLGVRQVRLEAEKNFDSKRSEVQQAMQSFKTEDALWLKAKQTMQILTKEIEDTAKWKETTKERFDAEQKELAIQQRILKISKFNSDLQRSEFENMSDETFETFLNGIEKAFNDKIEAERKEEEERQLKAKLEAERIENQRLENERLKLEAEERERQIEAERKKQREEAERVSKIRDERAKQLQPFIAFIRDYNSLINKSEIEYKVEFLEIKKGAELQWEFEVKERIRKQKEDEEREAELKAKRDAEIKAENERIEAEKKAKLEAEKLAKSPMKHKLNVWVDSFEINRTYLEDSETKQNIIEKFEAFKVWAKKEVEKL